MHSSSILGGHLVVWDVSVCFLSVCTAHTSEKLYPDSKTSSPGASRTFSFRFVDSSVQPRSFHRPNTSLSHTA